VILVAEELEEIGNMNKLFYRVGIESGQGLWYNNKGEFTGDIHTANLNWLQASQLKMPFEEQLVGYLSVADSLEHLYQWFSREELSNLQKIGFCVYEYEASDFKFYDLYKHNVINAKTSIITNKIILL